ncbi:hypothetical protein ACEU59_09745 [Buttiauxella noackiae]|uniref:hypothetical protein n=1 Tax=Buttiauxella noackiae TaxID=82992 RepID=UPI0035A64D8B
MITTKDINSVIRVLDGTSADLHKISTAIGMNSRECSIVLGTMLRQGLVIRTGCKRSYVYSLADNFISPEQIYQARLRVSIEKLEEQGRLMIKELRELLNETDWTARLFLDEACMRGELYKQGKQGIFLSFEHYEQYIETSLAQRKEKRRAANAVYRKTYRVKPKEATVDINIVCEECRANWQGYSVHKIFGSGARA